MEFTTFVRKPFTVKAVQITPDNIKELSRFIGDLEEKEDGTPYILVDRRKVPNVTKVYTGFWMTKLGENVRCYSHKIFKDQFVETDDSIDQWIDYLNRGGRSPDGANAKVDPRNASE